MSIDYGMGKTNIDLKTGIRYGVISIHEVVQSWSDSNEPYYPSVCPYCGNDIPEDLDLYQDPPVKCESCGKELHENDFDMCEAAYYFVDDEEYLAVDDDYGDIMIMRSPYYTRCPYCSPCAPGAGHLTGKGDDCRAYCFGPDWFEDEPPYKIYRVSDDSEVIYWTSEKVRELLPDICARLRDRDIICRIRGAKNEFATIYNLEDHGMSYEVSWETLADCLNSERKISL